MEEMLGISSNQPISLIGLSISLVIGFLLSFIVGWHYKNYGRTLANRSELAGVIPFICVTTVLIITVVKSSLALSLGLVGALSIIRFRTPIKEPEELAYLFLSIAIGLGLGASQFYATIGASLIIIILMTILRLGQNKNADKSINLWISISNVENIKPDTFIKVTQKSLSNIFSEVEIGNLTISENKYEYGCKILGADLDSMNVLIKEITDEIPAVEFNFLDESRIAGL
tara:strand:- start:731 stop:1417 length:687 start_codon:yes stop_codon:yes gene_type:complete